MIGESSSWNATQSTMVSNSIPLGGMMAMATLFVLLVAGIAIVWYAGSTLQRYKRLWEILNKISTAIVCAIIGAAAIGALWVTYLVLSELFKAVGGFDPMWILYSIGGFAVCAIVGAAILFLAGRVVENAEAAKAESPQKGDTIEELRAQ
jgi:hypothetical protein